MSELHPAGPEPRAALDAELARCLPRLRSHLRGRLASSSPGEADDLAQEVALRALRYAGSFEPGRALWPWLRTVADRVAWDRLRERGAEPRPSPGARPQEPEHEPAARPAPPDLELFEEVERLLSGLAPLERAVLAGFHLRGESIASLARSLGLPEGTVKSHLSRARRRLAGLPPSKPKDPA